MTNVPVGPNRANGQDSAGTPNEPWRENVAASSRSAGNSFKSADHRRKGSRELPKGKIAIALAALVIIIGLLLFFKPFSPAAGLIDGSKYQALFFTNGQVYFGKLTTLPGDYYKLTDIFYIQAADSSKNPQETGESNDASPQLVKLGEEIHGPDDAMIINRDQVLFFENLKKDGKVTDAITKYRAQNQ